MPIFDTRNVRPGDPVTAALWNAVQDALRRLEGIRGGPGIDVRRSKGGLQIAAVQPANRCLAVAIGAIPPRSGTTPGAGQVDRQWVASDGVLASTGEPPLDVVNPSASTMTAGAGIDDGLYCWVEQDAYGAWIVAPLECPSS